jgi:hypothetical protein
MVLLPVLGQVNLPIYNTDVGNLPGSSPDTHWSVTGPNIGEAQGSPALVLSGPALYPSWTTDTAASGWIGVLNPGSSYQPPVPYTFSETFSMAGFQVATAQISGFWGIDDYGQLFMNGIALSPSLSGGDYPWGYSMSFSVPDADLLPGLNTITAVLQQSDDNYEGVRVEFDTATADPAGVPDATSAALLLGIASAALAAGRRMTSRA